jgi:hypothetical protein
VLNNVNLGAIISAEIRPRVERLVRQADANNDGHLTTSEFSRFLADVVRKLEEAEASTGSTARATVASGPTAVKD